MPVMSVASGGMEYGATSNHKAQPFWKFARLQAKPGSVRGVAVPLSLVQERALECDALWLMHRETCLRPLPAAPTVKRDRYISRGAQLSCEVARL